MVNFKIVMLVRFTLDDAMKFHRGSRGVALLFF
jgi:hypothetical protein